MARNDDGRSDERGGRSGGKDRQHREPGRDRQDAGSGRVRNDRDDYYGNRPSEGDRSPGSNRYEGGGLTDGGGSQDGSNRSFANRSWDDGNRPHRNDVQQPRGEGGTSGSESGRGFGAPWSTNRERGNSEYDHGPFEDGDTNPRARGQGVYNHRPGQSGQENLGESGNRGSESGNWGSQSRGTEGGRARGNSYGDSGGDSYGGGGRHGGSRGDEGSAEGRTTHAGRGPKGWKRSDERVRDDVSEQLERHHDIDASDIEVKVEHGEVTLTGTVDDRRMKRLAEDVIEGMSGVTEVHNQIRVRRDERH